MSNFCERKRSHCSIVSAVLLTWLLLLPFAQTQTLTIGGGVDFKNLRSCAQNCIAGPGYNLGNILDCAYPYQNSCVCRSDLAPAASSWITKCVNSGCNSATVDLNQAVSLFDGYCSQINAPKPNVALTTLDSSSPTTTVVAVTTVTGAASNSPASNLSAASSSPTSTSTVTPSTRVTIQSTVTVGASATGGPGGKGVVLSTSDKIALGVGLSMGTLTIIIGWATYCRMKR